jgi:hypothetical protein
MRTSYELENEKQAERFPGVFVVINKDAKMGLNIFNKKNTTGFLLN